MNTHALAYDFSYNIMVMIFRYIICVFCIHMVNNTYFSKKYCFYSSLLIQQIGRNHRLQCEYQFVILFSKRRMSKHHPLPHVHEFFCRTTQSCYESPAMNALIRVGTACKERRILKNTSAVSFFILERNRCLVQVPDILLIQT